MNVNVLDIYCGQHERVVWDILSAHFLSISCCMTLHWFLYNCPATPGRLNDLVMNRVVDLRSVTFLVGLEGYNDTLC